MLENPVGVIKRDFIDSANSREFLDGSTRSFEILRSSGIGIGHYKPGWRWSIHAGPQTGKPSQNHIGYVISGRFIVSDASGFELTVGQGEAFEIAPGGDARVDGDEACVALDFISFVESGDITP